DHCALGGWFGEHSKLPASLTESMRFHHQPEQSDNARTLVALIAAADHMANHLQTGQEQDAYDPEQNLGLAHLWARWPEARKERFVGEISAMMEESVRAAISQQTG